MSHKSGLTAVKKPAMILRPTILPYDKVTWPSTDGYAKDGSAVVPAFTARLQKGLLRVCYDPTGTHECSP